MATLAAFLVGVLVAAAVAWGLAKRAGRVRLAQDAIHHHDDSAVPDLVTALDALPVGVVVVAADGSHAVRNQASRLDGVRHHQVLIDEALEALVARTALLGTPQEHLVELHGQQPRVMALSAHPLMFGGVIATMVDVSERVRLDRVRTDFVANLSHELKTPVGALAVLAETIVEVLSSPDPAAEDRAVASRLATKMVAEAHRMSQSINELLELSRIELEGLATVSEVLVSTIVTEAVDRVRSLAESADITVDVRLPEAPLTIQGDCRQLASALGNLLENAVKYSSPDGNVEIAVESSETGVEFRIRDWGVGIPARDLDRIFERFYRVDRARSRGTGGTGLGLAIVRHVATNHGGTVSVTSTEGEGSTFVLALPHVLPELVPTPEEKS
jgi:two-component system, OmpR family, sensor histidine kinase SenX3